MKLAKDNFSDQSEAYLKYRPIYPQDLYDIIFAEVQDFNNCWDCGTGNGQVAYELSKRFGHLEATDISDQQLDATCTYPFVLLCYELYESKWDHRACDIHVSY